jgi:prolipoprotein diacylglyceryltransferase
VLTLTFGLWYGTMRVVEDSLRIDKRFFGLTGSQWTGLTVAVICAATLLAWAVSKDSGASVGSADTADDDVAAT